MEEKLCYTASELCALTGLNKDNLPLYRNMGLLKAIQVGNKYLYPHKQVMEFLDKTIGMNIANKYTIIETQKK